MIATLETCLPEFRASAIPDRLTLANVRWLDGQEALRAFKPVDKTSPGHNFGRWKDDLKKWTHSKQGQTILMGGWLAEGCTINGLPDPVPYCKPNSPRLSYEFRGFGEVPKMKVVKYETPRGSEATPILPWVDDETAQQIYTRCQVTPLEGESFWSVVWRCNLQIALTEGLKKALCQIAHGMPAIALRGVCNWHRKGETDLHPTLAHFATSGRAIYIVFDQDSKPTTQKAVRTQVLKLGAALEKSGAKVSVCIWDGSQGKGIDDAVFGLGIRAQTWFNTVFENALDLPTYKRDAWILQSLETITRLNTLSYPAERATDGEYLPELPPVQPGIITAISSSVDTGKTTRIGADWVKSVIALGWNCLVLTPINNLGKQAAHDWKLPHIHNYGTQSTEQQALWADVSHSHGLVLCPNSLHRLPDWFWSRPTLLILDEANQVIDHLCQGDTLGSRYSLILEKFTAAARHAIETGAIVLSEDGLPDRAVNFVKTLSGSDSVRVFHHKKQGIPWNCKVFSGQASGYRARFLQAVTKGGRQVFVTSSQAEAERQERVLRKRHPDKKVVRIDSKTNQQGQFTSFFEQPHQWLQDNQPDVLILSPSAKSGVSIEGGVSPQDAYFDSVWGYFPSLATDTHWQMLARYRPSVPRFIFVPDFILSNGDESLLNPRLIKRRLRLNSQSIAGVYGLETLLDEGNVSELQATIEMAVLDYLAASKAVSGVQKSIANIALVDRLKKAGHQVECERLAKDGNMVNLWREVQEEVWRDQAAMISTAKVEGHHTQDWALKELDRLEVSLEGRTLAQKILWREEFPGLLFDDPEECYQTLCKDNGAMRHGILLQAKAENLEAAKESDRKAVEAVLKGDIRAFHRLPKGYVKSLLIAESGVLELLDGSTYSNADPRCQKVKKFALRFKKEISYWIRLQVQDSQTAVEICHKLLKKLGLERDQRNRPGAVRLVGRLGKRSQNSERFSIDLSFNPVRIRLLEAARRNLSESVTPIRNTGQDPSIQINVTGQEGPQNTVNEIDPPSLAAIRSQQQESQPFKEGGIETGRPDCGSGV